ncbi:hypothetical protein E4U46_001107 [Claviceps purpurea]|nr:hypothetical protein E4U51_007358 [Claviceps purpurea]KAG6291375.1 hypothetical protein E4U46_001107 [Claviceps purpurea]
MSQPPEFPTQWQIPLCLRRQALSNTCSWCRTNRQAPIVTAACAHVIVNAALLRTYAVAQTLRRWNGKGALRSTLLRPGQEMSANGARKKALVGSASHLHSQHRHDTVNLVPVHKSRIFICRRAVASRNGHPKQGPIPSLSASHLMTRCLDASRL